MSTFPIKQFCLMGGAVYYACGGFEDYIDSFDAEDEAREVMNKWLEDKGDYYWAHVIDTKTGKGFQRGEPEATMARFAK